MSRYSNPQIFDEIKNGNEEILFHLSDLFFQSCRRQLRRYGCRDSDTPEVFSNYLTFQYRNIQQNNIASNIDLEGFILNSLKDYFYENYASENSLPDKEINPETEREAIVSCFNIMDENSKKILALRYLENLSFEQIAVRLSFSNPVIAEFEFNKAFDQFENIARARLTMPVED